MIKVDNGTVELEGELSQIMADICLVISHLQKIVTKKGFKNSKEKPLDVREAINDALVNVNTKKEGK